MADEFGESAGAQALAVAENLRNRDLGFADQALGKLNLERAIEPQQQFGSRETVERQIAVEVTVQLHIARINQVGVNASFPSLPADGTLLGKLPPLG